MGDGTVIHDNSNFSALVRQFMNTPEDMNNKTRLLRWMEKIVSSYEYIRAFLCDSQGKELLSFPPGPSAVFPVIMEGITEVCRADRPTLVDFYREPSNGRVYLAVLVPIGDVVLCLQIDPELYLFPLIKLWPTPSRTAETLLVRSDGDAVVFLNELRFQNNMALNIRFPLEKTEHPAVQAVLGREGLWKGKDYREVPVIAYLRRIPESPWFLVAKIDTTEIYGSIRERLWMTVVIVTALLLGAGTGGGLILRNQQMVFYRQKYKTAEALLESENRYRATLDTLMEGCQIIGFDWRYLYVNDAAANYGRRGKDELIGRTVTEMYPGIENTDLFATMKIAMTERTGSFNEYGFDFPDGTRRWFEFSFTPIPEGIFILTLDITDRKAAEAKILRLNLDLEQKVKERTFKLEALNKEMESFAYSVSHDLRTPLRAIDGFSRILTEDYAGSLDPEGIRLLNVVRSNIQRMGDLITDILALSRITRAEPRRIRIDITDMVNLVIQETMPAETRNTFSLVVGPLPEAVGDPNLLRQVWTNLISNAVKFTLPKQDRKIEIGGAEEKDENIYYIKDSGVGFNPGYTHKLFGVFQRLHKPEDFEGTGVGLAIVQRIITSHGGRVWAEGRMNEGAVFYFSLPADKEVKNDG